MVQMSLCAAEIRDQYKSKQYEQTRSPIIPFLPDLFNEEISKELEPP
jgi:hypothetical protein